MLTPPSGVVGVDPLPAIADDHNEADTTWLVTQLMMRIAQRQDDPDEPKIVMRGGTAAKLAYGLSRPSKDIDLDIVSKRHQRDVWNLIEEAASAAGLTAVTDRHPKSRLKGQLHLTDGRKPSITIDVDVRPVHDKEDALGVMEKRTTTVTNGILTYRPEILAAQKIRLANLPEARLRPKDAYDIAWWISQGIRHVPKELRIVLDETLHERPEVLRTWERGHQDNAVTRRIPWASVQSTILTALSHDPAVLQARSPEDKIELLLGQHTGGTLHHRTPQDPEPRVLAQFRNDQELQDYLTSFGMWNPRQVPELLRDLQAERARARQRTPK